MKFPGIWVSSGGGPLENGARVICMQNGAGKKSISDKDSIDRHSKTQISSRIWIADRRWPKKKADGWGRFSLRGGVQSACQSGARQRGVRRPQTGRVEQPWSRGCSAQTPQWHSGGDCGAMMGQSVGGKWVKKHPNNNSRDRKGAKRCGKQQRRRIPVHEENDGG